MLVQPEAADDVAAALADVAVSAPVNGTVELAGPERFRLDELARRVLRAHNDPRRVTAEADVLRDDGEAYAARLRAAGVAVTTVRYDGITHDFMMLNPLSGTHATRAAVAQASSILRDAPHSA